MSSQQEYDLQLHLIYGTGHICTHGNYSTSSSYPEMEVYLEKNLLQILSICVNTDAGPFATSNLSPWSSPAVLAILPGQIAFDTLGT